MPYKDPEKRREAQRRADKKWYAAHKDKKLAYQKVRQQLGLTHAADKKWYAKNREKKIQATIEWGKQNLDRRLRNNRKSNLMKFYGMTLAQYDQLLISQNYACAICGTHESNTPSGRLHVDHDHTTNKEEGVLVRGLLCVFCNSMLGHARDNTDVLAKGIAYLNRYPKAKQ